MPTREENLNRIQVIFDELKEKPKGIKIGCEIIVDPEKFFNAHMKTVRNVGKDIGQPYYDRMVKWITEVIKLQKQKNESK
jgi:hypothetical protein